MHNGLAARKFISALFATGLLIYILFRTQSPKIILLPFLICSISLTGKSLSQMLRKEKLASVFHKVFILGFLLFWFGFLAVAAFISIRDKSYSMLLFTLPFWLVGIYLVKRWLLGKKGKQSTCSPFRFAHIVSAALVTVALLAGIFLLALGMQRSQTGLLFAGGFFIFGGFTFILATLTMRGVFDKCKIDVLGMYMGIFLAVLGIGIIVWKAEVLKVWVLMPALLVIAGTAQIIKCLKNKK